MEVLFEYERYATNKGAKQLTQLLSYTSILDRSQATLPTDSCFPTENFPYTSNLQTVVDPSPTSLVFMSASVAMLPDDTKYLIPAVDVPLISSAHPNHKLWPRQTLKPFKLQ